MEDISFNIKPVKVFFFSKLVSSLCYYQISMQFIHSPHKQVKDSYINYVAWTAKVEARTCMIRYYNSIKELIYNYYKVFFSSPLLSNLETPIYPKSN